VRHEALDIGRQMTNHFLVVSKSQDNPAAFHARFSGYYRLLYFIACRVLGDPERAEDAVANCRLKASQNPPEFAYESEFRSWLLRVLIDEALAILRQRRRALKTNA